MLIIILLITTFNLTSSAPVLPSTSDFEAAAPVTIFGRELPECANVAHYRTVQAIILSCLATIFACTWVSLHPNVPPPENSKWKNLWEKVVMMATALLGPEIFIAMAAFEWGRAINNAVIYNQKHHGVTPPSSFIRWYFSQGEKRGHWTITHGFLLIMDGLVDDSGEVINSVEHIPEPLDISEEEINDKSKGDFLTKLFVVLQTTWFICQCLARWITHLPVTELEVTTLAYAVLNIFIYALRWNKPQRMGIPLRMSRYTRHEGKGTLSEVVSGEHTDEAHSLFKSELSRESRSMNRVAQIVKSFICRWSRLMGGAIVGSLPHRFRSLKFDWVVGLICKPFRPLAAVLSKSKVREFPTAYVGGAVIGSVFGGLHLIPLWLSSFPSPVEKLLWKICAILVTIQPFIVCCGFALGGTVIDDEFPLTVFLWVVISTVLYVVARIILLVLAFTTLRELPPDAFRNVAWITFIPHL